MSDVVNHIQSEEHEEALETKLDSTFKIGPWTIEPTGETIFLPEHLHVLINERIKQYGNNGLVNQNEIYFWHPEDSKKLYTRYGELVLPKPLYRYD